MLRRFALSIVTLGAMTVPALARGFGGVVAGTGLVLPEGWA